ncbi:MAG: YbhB/YbcL family Raf kinase inhibitor-like protein [Pseudomonadota bacterium]
MSEIACFMSFGALAPSLAKWFNLTIENHFKADHMKRLALLTGLFFLTTAASAAQFLLHSEEFKERGPLSRRHVLNAFGCTGHNMSPSLAWDNPPAGTKSFALLVHDADAPTGGSGWWHWVVVNLPATTRSLVAGAGHRQGRGLPPGSIQVDTDFGHPGWGGPCPPEGGAPHNYVFTLHALKVEKLPLPPNSTAAMAGYLINAHSLGRAVLTATYSRP